LQLLKYRIEPIACQDGTVSERTIYFKNKKAPARQLSAKQGPL